MKYLSPLSVEGEVKLEGLSTIAAAAATIFTTTNSPDYDGALYVADVYVRVNTADSASDETLAISIVATEGASARTTVVPLQTEAGAVVAALTALAVGSYSGSIVFRADKNTAVQWSRTAGGTPNNNGDFDVIITIRRVR